MVSHYPGCRPPPQSAALRTVKLIQGAVPTSSTGPFPRTASAPGVPVSEHRALHKFCAASACCPHSRLVHRFGTTAPRDSGSRSLGAGLQMGVDLHERGAIQASRRRHVERTHARRNAFQRLARCYERRAPVIDTRQPRGTELDPCRGVPLRQLRGRRAYVADCVVLLTSSASAYGRVLIEGEPCATGRAIEHRSG
jgi:hypothetical protein